MRYCKALKSGQLLGSTATSYVYKHSSCETKLARNMKSCPDDCVHMAIASMAGYVLRSSCTLYSLFRSVFIVAGRPKPAGICEADRCSAYVSGQGSQKLDLSRCLISNMSKTASVIYLMPTAQAQKVSPSQQGQKKQPLSGPTASPDSAAFPPRYVHTAILPFQCCSQINGRRTDLHL